MGKKSNKCHSSSTSSCAPSCESSSTQCVAPPAPTITLLGGGWFNSLFRLGFLPDVPQYLSLWTPNLSPVSNTGRIVSQTILTRPGIMRRLAVYIGDSNSATGTIPVGTTMTFTVMRNSTPTPLFATFVGGAAGAGTDSFRVFNLNVAVEYLAGDSFSLQTTVNRGLQDPPGFSFSLEYHVLPEKC